MHRILISLFCIAFSLQVIAQTNPPRIIIDTEGDVHPWNHLNAFNGAETFQFAIVTDRTGGLRPGVFPVAVDKLNLLMPEFVMSVGDLITGYTADTARIDKEWEEFTGFIDKLKVPFFYVPGNHDYINEVMAYKWKERFGKDYYHFVYKDVLFLCLNSEEKMRGAGRGYIDDPQLAYIQKTLEENQDVKWTMVFLHQPLWDQGDNGKWPEVEQLLSERKHTVFAGHRHRYVKYERNDSKYFILATTGGGSGLRGPQFGEFDHVVWITMTDQGPIMANLLLDGIWDENVNTEERYAVTRPLMGKNPIQFQTLLVDSDKFSGGELPLRIDNDSDVPLELSLQFSSNQHLWIAMDPVEKIIPPNSVEQLDLPIKTTGNISLDQVKPLDIQAKLTYKPEGQPELELDRSIQFKPVPWNNISSSGKAIEIDGKLKEWGKLRHKVEDSAFIDADPFSHQGTKDCSFQFDTRYDEEFVYVAVAVQDDDIYSSESVSHMDQDVVALMFDARPLAQTAGPPSGRLFREYLLLAAAHASEGNPQLYLPDRQPKGVKVASQSTRKGYTIEYAIPVDYLNKRQGDDWQNFRLNVIVQDMDKEGMHKTTLSWQPEWTGDKNMMGTGMFRRVQTKR